MRKVAVLGGGMGGLSAAFELASRGFAVEIYEKLDVLGGKARSFPFPGTGRDDRPDLPAEHGFRVFPGWYAHVSDTMARIPYDGPGAKPGMTVADRLVKVPYLAYAMEGQEPFYFTTSFPDTAEEWLAELHALFTHKRLGLSRDDAAFFIRRLVTFLGSCEARRQQVYENIDWWTYIEADKRSAAFQRVCANGLTRSLVATRPRRSSTYTVATILIQMLYTMLRGDETDRILDGPTSEVWIKPWRRKLEAMGVTFHTGAHVDGLTIEDGRVVSAEVRVGGETRSVVADQFVCALPVEIVSQTTRTERQVLTEAQLRAAGLISDAADGPDIRRLEVAWMNGIIYYADRSAAMVKGHVIYIDSAWALTSVSQAQFWDEAFRLDQYGDGRVRDILSAIISEWDSAENPAEGVASRQAIIDEAWRQMAVARPRGEPGGLGWENVTAAYLDPDITDVGTRASIHDTEPLLTNTAGSVRDRPGAATAIANLFLASDYVNTFTNLATMEGANEAGRRAANAVLDAAGWEGERAMVTPLKEPAIFDGWKRRDAEGWNPAAPGEPPIAALVDELMGGTSWFWARLALLDLALEGYRLWDWLRGLLGFDKHKHIRFHRHHAKARQAVHAANSAGAGASGAGA